MEGTSSHVAGRKNLSFFALLLLFLVGMIYGVLMLKGGDTFGWMQLYTGEYFSALGERTLLQSFFTSFSSVFFYLLASYLLGFCAIGQPVLLLLPFFRGLGLGAFMGYLYVSYGFSGVGYCFLVLLPAAVIALLAILIACRESLRLSAMLFSNFVLGRGTASGRGVMKLYNLKYLILCAFALASALISTLCIVLFGGIFHLAG